MKKYLYLIIFILLISNVYAINFKDITSFERDNKNNVCDKGEFPLLDKDCKLDFSDIMNKVWFWKILLIAGIYYLVKKKDLLDKRVIAVILIIILISSISFKEEPKQEGEILKINKTEQQEEVNPLEKTSVEKALDWFLGLGERIAGENVSPIIGWIILITIIWVVSGILNIGEDIRDRFFDFKIKNWFRRKIK